MGTSRCVDACISHFSPTQGHPNKHPDKIHYVKSNSCIRSSRHVPGLTQVYSPTRKANEKPRGDEPQYIWGEGEKYPRVEEEPRVHDDRLSSASFVGNPTRQYSSKRTSDRKHRYRGCPRRRALSREHHTFGNVLVTEGMGREHRAFRKGRGVPMNIGIGL